MIILDQIKEIIRGEYKITYNGVEYASFDEVKTAAKNPGRVTTESVMCIDGTLTVALIDIPVAENTVDGNWAEEYKKKFGTEPSLF